MASFLSTPLIEAENALAGNAAFVAWCGATDVADAQANYIFSDDVAEESLLPSRYAGISELEGWNFGRVAEGAGRGSFRFSAGQFAVVFIQEVGNQVTCYTAENRIEFKDTVAGFITQFMDDFEGLGQRLNNVSMIPFSETFPMRGEVSSGGVYYYQYGVIFETGIF